MNHQRSICIAGNENVISRYDVLCLLPTYVPAMVENEWLVGNSRWLRPIAASPGAECPWNNKAILVIVALTRTTMRQYITMTCQLFYKNKIFPARALPISCSFSFHEGCIELKGRLSHSSHLQYFFDIDPRTKAYD
ncbi:hypothetical protein TcasGA2_TC007621 [Tribolium castaneum]|uniref:Uncharacterized protein n=1 Tax=Tribolium castaneum TaxID=7070 RepID=D2A2V3_TRICA|nr:hypothetical protein TcasGA2_TC007621 [Tribolium castaneum]